MKARITFSDLVLFSNPDYLVISKPLGLSPKGVEFRRDELLRRLVDIQYSRNDVDFHRGTFRVRGDVVEIFPAYEEALAIRVEYFGDEIEAIKEVDPVRGKVVGQLDRYAVYPGSHYVTEQQQLRGAIQNIREELRERHRRNHAAV